MRKLSRRRFIQYMLAASAVASVPSFLLSRRNIVQAQSPIPAQRVIVVGAGLAGLTAAYEFMQAGHDVTVLEARDRVGGRAYSTHGFANGQYGDHGGEFLDAEDVHTQMYYYARLFGLEIATTGYVVDGGGYFYDGQIFDYDDEDGVISDAAWESYEAFYGIVEEITAILGDYVENPQEAPIAAELASLTVAEWLDTLDLHPVARLVIMQEVEGEYDDINHCGALFYLQNLAVYADADDDAIEVARIAGGSDVLAQAFADALGERVLLNSPVTAIEQDDNGVRVVYAGGDMQADYAVIATPLPPLRRVTFTPSLDPELQAAIDELGYGFHVKVLTQYSRRWWLDTTPPMVTMASIGMPTGWFWEQTEQQAGDEGIYASYSSKKDAQDYNELDDVARIAAVHAELETIFPDIEKEVIEARTHSWANDEYAGGAYSAYSAEQVMRFWDVLRRPHGRLILAGEHTDTLFIGYMEGAVRSGQRAVEHLETLVNGA